MDCCRPSSRTVPSDSKIADSKIAFEGCYSLAVLGTDGPGDRAQGWAAALQTYREAVDIYRRVLELQAQRQVRVEPRRRRSLPPPRAVEPLPTTQDPSRLLTPREWEVAHLVARGYTNRQIAETLVLTRGTVANHVAHILGKLNAANRTQIAAYYLNAAAEEPAAAAEISNGWANGRIRKVG